ncbi:heme o synthase [Nibricoccus sp. IMCC34717]|uniref:heme o synthase n=1 Tax=Nibricoccus sp. IMCC34717 TaxID=3034021 RepID=UPI00384F0475
MTTDNPTQPRAADYFELTKPRLSLLSVATAVFGYFSSRPVWNAPIFLWMLAGTSLCAAGVAALNQWMESDTDAKMRRTSDRPIPAGRMPTGSAFVLGWGCCAGGLALLYANVSGFAALFALLTIISYLALYTPAKRWSRHSTEIGAVAGAFPPLIGWAAAGPGDAALGWILFALLFFWQMPHFMAIAWIYRADYSAVHFPNLAVRDEGGRKVARWSLVNTFASALTAAAPTAFGLSGWVYLGGSLVLGLWFLARAWDFDRAVQGHSGTRTPEQHARRLFLASVTWLPLQMLLLVADRVLHLP